MADTKTAAERLCEYANEQVKNGSIYVLGAQGQTGSQITTAWIKKREHYKAENYNRAIALWKKRLAAGYKNLCAYDCSGLVVKWLMSEGYLKSDKTANGLYFDACYSIGKSALKAGDLVFMKYASKNRMYHVGIYVGGGDVVHDKGRDDGVVRESISAGKWNRYGRLKCCGAASASEYTRLLKLTVPYMNGTDVAAVQAALADRGYSPGGTDGYYGPTTEAAVKAYQTANGLEADGIVGPKTWAALFDSGETSPEEPEEPSVTPTVAFTRNLQYTPGRYMRGEDVKAVQAALLAAGFSPKGADGSFGPETEAAVIAFQKANGLEVDGIVGPKTWAALFDMTDDGEDDAHETPETPETPAVSYKRLLKNAGKPYMSGEDVKAVQVALKAAGFDPKGVDGSFGPDTEAAVKAYQKAKGLEADGIVGPKTWAALFDQTDDGEDDAPETPEKPAVSYTRLLKNTGKPYMSGADVKAVQTALKAAGFDPKGADGSFGPDTEAAVKAYQKAKGLEADGIVGPKTWAALFG